jgi:phospholipase C
MRTVLAFSSLVLPVALSGCVTSGDASASCDGGSCIEHLVVIVQENHTFDDHFGGYCTATPGSNPACNAGPSCCEAMPAADPSGTKPTILTDVAHAGFDPNQRWTDS